MRASGELRRGFSVIELMVVVAILSILVAILIPVLHKMKLEAKKVACANHMVRWGQFIATQATTSTSRGVIPRLAADGDQFYDASELMKKRFADFDLPPEIAYSPSHPRLGARSDWGVLEWEYETPDFAGAVIIDNTDALEPSAGTPVEYARDDEEAPHFIEGAGGWLTYAEGAAGECEGDSAHYCDDPDADAWWRLDIPEGSGDLTLEAFVQKGPLGHPNVLFEVEGRDGDVGSPQTSASISLVGAAEESAWVTLGDFRIEGPAVRIVKVKSVGAGGGGIPPDLTWDGTPGHGLIDPEPGPGDWVHWSVVAGDYVGTEACYTPDALSATWTVTIPEGYSGDLQVDAFVRKGTSRCRSVRYTIQGTGGAPTYLGRDLYDASTTAGWLFDLGTHRFHAGTRTITVEHDPDADHVADGCNMAKHYIWFDAIRLTGTLEAETTWDGSAGNGLIDVEPLPDPPWTNWIVVPTDCIGESAAYTADTSASGVWTIEIPPGQSGDLQLEAWVRKGTSRCRHVRYTIQGTDGAPDYETADLYNASLTTMFLNLGTHRFDGGSRTVTVEHDPGADHSGCNLSKHYIWFDAIRLTGTTSAQAGGSRLWADAVRLSGLWEGVGPLPDGYHVTEGMWGLSSWHADHYGSNYQHGKRDGSGTRRAAWYFHVASPGTYGVYGYWCASANRASDVKFTIHGGGGATKTVYANQQDEEHNGEWRKLDEMAFNPAEQGSVEIECSGSEADEPIIIADAIAITTNRIASESRSVLGYLYFGYRADPAGFILDPDGIPMPINLNEVDNPSGTVMLADMFARGNQTWTTHPDGAHILFLDGRVEWRDEEELIQRWTDIYGVTFSW